MPHASQAIKNFLHSTATPFSRDLVDRVISLTPSLEIQVNVRQGLGKPVPDRLSTFCDDDDNHWFSFRLPKNAYTDEPFWNDFNMPYSLEDHCEAIGSTGWDWKTKTSRWVGFDFDSIVGHAEGVGLTNEELLRIRDQCMTLPFVEIRRSTGGAGLHLYVPLDGITTSNHNEHAAVGSRVLDKISELVGVDFRKKVDCLGSNLWVWHSRANVEARSFELLKPSERPLTTGDIPDWKEHLDVVRHRSQRVRVTGLPQGEEDIFTQLACSYQHVPLDDTHHAIRDALSKVDGCTTMWVQGYYLLQTHTHALKQVHKELGLQGVFETLSPGTDLSTPNCFAFPQRNGSWRVYRFGRATKEHPSWDQTTGWTWCWLNHAPNLAAAASTNRGSETKGGWQFPSLKYVEGALKTLGVEEPNIRKYAAFKNRPVVVTQETVGTEQRITVQVPKQKGDKDFLEGWNSSDSPKNWTSYITLSSDMDMDEGQDHEHMLRCLETCDGSSAGWAAKKKDGDWTRKGAGSIKMILQSLGLPKADAEIAMGKAELVPWKLVTVPFCDEYPGDRQWNLGAPQLRVTPAPRPESGSPNPHPHWDLLLDHLGGDLDKHINPSVDGFHSGRDYLQGWFASVIQQPYEPLPYLFFYGPQASGKSTFHESFDLLVTGGVVKASRALTSKTDFNGELAGAILCVIEEIDLTKDTATLNRIKEVVTCKKLSIRKMRTDPFMLPNTTHWVHCANSMESVPVFDGDSRITMIYVPKPTKEIPKTLLLDRLKDEAPAFLRTLLDYELPPLTGRLRIPVIDTGQKKWLIAQNRSSVERFIAERVVFDGGMRIKFADFYDEFQKWLPETEAKDWGRNKTSRRLPVDHATVQGTDNITFVSNARWKDGQ